MLIKNNDNIYSFKFYPPMDTQQQLLILNADPGAIVNQTGSFFTIFDVNIQVYGLYFISSPPSITPETLEQNLPASTIN